MYAKAALGIYSWVSRVGLVFLGMLIASPVSAAPVYCELAALPSLPLASDSTESFTPEELMNRVAESYRGLLEFAGDEFSEERLNALILASLEEFFEPVTVAEQRSVALNDSLTKLGDWVLLEAEGHGLTQAIILARLREVVQAHLQRSHQEQERTRDTREERREPPSVIREFEPFVDVNANGVWSAIVGKDHYLVTGTHNHAVRRWDFSDLTSAGGLEFPEGLNIGVDGGILPVPVAMGDTEQVLIQYIRSPVLEVWNARTLTRVGQWKLEHENSASDVKLSPSLRYVASSNESQALLTVLDLESGQLHRPSIRGRLHRLSWSEDGRYLVLVSGPWTAPWDLQIYRFDAHPDGTSQMGLVFKETIGTGVKVVFGVDHEHLLISDNQLIQSLHLENDQLHVEWKYERAGISIHDNATLRSAHSGAREIVYATPQSIDLLNPMTGDLIKSLEIPAPWSVGESLLSSSGKFLAVKLRAESGKKGAVWIWNLETRTLHAQLDVKALEMVSFSHSESELLLQVGGGQEVMVWDFSGYEFE